MSDSIFCSFRGQEMKYSLCSQLPSRSLTWDFLGLLGHRIYNIWWLTRYCGFFFKPVGPCVKWLLLLTMELFWPFSLLNRFSLFFSQFVSPMCYSHIYSEKIVHLPHCYFVNDYKQVNIEIWFVHFHTKSCGQANIYSLLMPPEKSWCSRSWLPAQTIRLWATWRQIHICLF